MSSSPRDLSVVLDQVQDAVANQQLSATAADNIGAWLSEERYAPYVAQVVEHVLNQQWQELDDVFWTVIPFGTGGRRGRMYPIGSNAINDRTIGESARGLADYVRQITPGDQDLACAIAYDTRHRSRHFAEQCAGIMVAAGFQVYFLDDYRPTPELSFLVRQRHCQCGIMVTASHNPPSDNAVKVYGPGGGQVRPPHDQGIIDAVAAVQSIPQVNFQEAVQDGRVIIDTHETDQAYLQQVTALGSPGPRDLKIIYSPLHGVGSSGVLPVLQQAGFTKVSVYEPHARPDGNFPNVPGHVSNPENPAIFDPIIHEAQEQGAHLILVTDPDADRMGCAAPLTTDPTGPWATLDGNSLSALLADYVLSRKQEQGTLTPEHYVIKTLVTTDMVRRIADAYGVRTCGDVLVGFKWICGRMDDEGPDQMAYATEESHGFLVGQHVRDKDGMVACLLMAELAAQVRHDGKSLHDYLATLYEQHGLHQERTLNIRMEGSQGMHRMTRLMQALRNQPPETLGEIPVIQRRDYREQATFDRENQPQPMTGPVADLVFLDLDIPGNYVAVRPSGTEPKIKIYLFLYQPPGSWSDLATARSELQQRADLIESTLRDYVTTYQD